MQETIAGGGNGEWEREMNGGRIKMMDQNKDTFKQIENH